MNKAWNFQQQQKKAPESLQFNSAVLVAVKNYDIYEYYLKSVGWLC